MRVEIAGLPSRWAHSPVLATFLGRQGNSALVRWQVEHRNRLSFGRLRMAHRRERPRPNDIRIAGDHVVLRVGSRCDQPLGRYAVLEQLAGNTESSSGGLGREQIHKPAKATR